MKKIFSLLKFGDQLRHYVVEISDDTEIGGSENGGILVLVHSGDHLCVTEAGDMLDLARNADAQVKIRFHSNAGESYAALFGQPVKFLGNRPCAADFTAQGVGQLQSIRDIYLLTSRGLISVMLCCLLLFCPSRS